MQYLKLHSLTETHFIGCKILIMHKRLGKFIKKFQMKLLVCRCLCIAIMLILSGKFVVLYPSISMGEYRILSSPLVLVLFMNEASNCHLHIRIDILCTPILLVLIESSGLVWTPVGIDKLCWHCFENYGYLIVIRIF